MLRRPNASPQYVLAIVAKRRELEEIEEEVGDDEEIGEAGADETETRPLPERTPAARAFENRRRLALRSILLNDPL